MKGPNVIIEEKLKQAMEDPKFQNILAGIDTEIKKLIVIKLKEQSDLSLTDRLVLISGTIDVLLHNVLVLTETIFVSSGRERLYDSPDKMNRFVSKVKSQLFNSYMECCK